mmetsp:Transcript_107142/g.207618  ORF Transcript_107142/g.207618 Transcript_107142/m.207618 type:complete len:97 (+) Transcript_107142:215-505(+)
MNTTASCPKRGTSLVQAAGCPSIPHPRSMLLVAGGLSLTSATSQATMGNMSLVSPMGPALSKLCVQDAVLILAMCSMMRSRTAIPMASVTEPTGSP